MRMPRLDFQLPPPRQAAQLGAILWIGIAAILLPSLAAADQLRGAEWVAQAGVMLSGAALTVTVYLGLSAGNGKPLWLGVAITLIALAGAAAIQTASDFGIQALVHGLLPTRLSTHSPEETLIVRIIYFLIYACAGAVFVVTGVLQRIRSRERELARAEIARLRAELALLRLQLNPHFLYNSLNAFSALITLGRADEANRLAEGLAEFLHAAMDLDGSEVPLARELELIECYLDLEQARFGERLRVETDAPATLHGALVPGFLLQPLVENAIKHGVEASAGTASLRIAAARAGTQLVLTVENRSAPAPAAAPVRPGRGIGLANTRARLEMLFAGEASLETGAVADGFRAAVRLPLKLA
ncbi:MAG: histidine kinase [Sphingomonas sp.]|uniref:sensor histidine kinase n=1 Tax=Sphingomonas sp. TaxID=28214 RepID=UPI0025F76EA2|nr:histidine kinase [Sphingomonas sp.]MBQ1497922.1 histidine kinase [Sphingomonas sp.]